MQQWGWRIPFATGGLLAVFALWLRRNMMESEHSPSSNDSAGATVWSRQQVLQHGVRLFLYEAGSTLTYYTWVTSAAIYAISVKGMEAHSAFMMSCIDECSLDDCLGLYKLIHTGL